jgi:hypothetical protein
MRILFCTQNQTLSVFHNLDSEMRKTMPVECTGYIVADRFYYAQFIKSNPEFENGCSALVKEWELTANPTGEADLKYLSSWEKRLAVPNLFHVMLSDRRMVMGKNCAFSQDYSPRFSDQELLVILERAVRKCDELLNSLRPDAIIGFISVTFLDFLIVKMAKARGIRVLNLRPSRIGDRVYFANDLLDPTVEVQDLFVKVKENGSRFDEQARQYLEKFRATKGRYEGVVAPSDKPARRLNVLRGPVRALARQLANYRLYRASGADRDNHVPDFLKSLFYAGVVNPVRARRQRRWLSPHYFDLSSSERFRFAFYPLHAEPEVSLLVYGRPFINQIEVIRSIADSLPVDMLLLVKEHPWMVGKRKDSWYRKLLEIPKVRLVGPVTEARTVIKSSELTFVIAGSVAFEAAILGKPAITMGHVPFNILPDTMVTKCTDLAALPEKVKWLLEYHRHDESALLSYVSAMMEATESVQWYSTLLQRTDSYRERTSDFRAELQRLAGYIAVRLQSPAGA